MHLWERDTESLQALIARCAAGDRLALHRLYQLQAPRLKGIAQRITRNEALAEDVIHDVFLQVWRDAGQFDPARSPASAWLVMLTRFRALDLLRRDQREPLTDRIPQEADDAPDALSRVIIAAETSRLQACMDALTPRGRDAIRLAFLEGLTHQQIAMTTNMPLGTAKSLIRRALIDLRRCMDP